MYIYRNEVYLSTSCSAVDEESVVAYAPSKEIVASNVSENVSSEEEKSREETGTDSALDVSVTASQIDTSTAQFQNTLEHRFGPGSDSDSSLSREHVVGAFQLLLSGAESNMDSADGAESGVDGDTCDDAVAVSADDVNLLSTGDLSDDYEYVGSSGSEDSDSVEDDVVERRVFPEEEVLLDEEAALTDDEFIQSLGGTLTLDAMDKNALRHFQCVCGGGGRLQNLRRIQRSTVTCRTMLRPQSVSCKILPTHLC
ncbi:hypothetical protein PI125_g17171 [Phytophthora idaei]|nr:hypothetical protein PI125_g17171 [Phytophthora idaei]